MVRRKQCCQYVIPQLIIKQYIFVSYDLWSVGLQYSTRQHFQGHGSSQQFKRSTKAIKAIYHSPLQTVWPLHMSHPSVGQNTCSLHE